MATCQWSMVNGETPSPLAIYKYSVRRLFAALVSPFASDHAQISGKMDVARCAGLQPDEEHLIRDLGVRVGHGVSFRRSASLRGVTRRWSCRHTARPNRSVVESGGGRLRPRVAGQRDAAQMSARSVGRPRYGEIRHAWWMSLRTRALPLRWTAAGVLRLPLHRLPTADWVGLWTLHDREARGSRSAEGEA